MSDPSPDQPRRRRLRKATRAVTRPVRWLTSAAAELARTLLDSVKWPFERLFWAIQRRLVWPAQDRRRRQNRKTRSLRPSQGLTATVLVSAATVTGAGVALLSLPDLDQTAIAGAPAASPSVASVSVSTARISTDTPPLRGKAPSFESDRKGPAPTKRSSAAPAVRVAAAPPAPTVDPTAAPDAALTTAERFARAFVTYEVGRSNARVENAFRATASPPLVRALAQRPPRLPAKVDVPKARVLNVVAGRKLGRTLSVSVALVRLGAMSELRLQLDKTKAGWLISDVRG